MLWIWTHKTLEWELEESEDHMLNSLIFGMRSIRETAGPIDRWKELESDPTPWLAPLPLRLSATALVQCLCICLHLTLPQFFLALGASGVLSGYLTDLKTFLTDSFWKKKTNKALVEIHWVRQFFPERVSGSEHLSHGNMRQQEGAPWAEISPPQSCASSERPLSLCPSEPLCPQKLLGGSFALLILAKLTLHLPASSQGNGPDSLLYIKVYVQSVPSLLLPLVN